MNAFKTILFVALVAACVTAEPPRRRFGFRKFARQEIDDSASAPEEQPQESDKPGYDYTPPAESQRLRLPLRIRLNAFARQEEAPQSNGYSYPKPDSTYGPPTSTDESEPSEQPPSTDYGVPEETTTTESQPEELTDEPETTINPQAERLKSVRASQLRRQNAKLVKLQKSVRARQQVQQPQPVFYFQYPINDFEPQYVYVFK